MAGEYVQPSTSSGSTLPREEKEWALAVHSRLLAFYGYPEWREPLPPLDELVATILSQNTNDANSYRAFLALKGRYPDWETVRNAPEAELIDTIRSAGLANQKGPRIQSVLRAITAQRGDLDISFLKELPDAEVMAWLTGFKGVGPKTASIVMQFSLDKPAFPVDTHIFRVTGRIGLRPPKMNPEQAHVHLAGLFSPDAYYPVHLNLIRLGREICHARRPECHACPILDLCITGQELIFGPDRHISSGK
jgi:endonuclease-3